MRVHIEGGARPRPASRRTIYCDGAHDDAFRPESDLELSHWIPNRTPARYKADTSTAICLAFVADPTRARDFDLALNNHLDVDGMLALFVLATGEAALAGRETLIQAAEMGDFWAYGGVPAQTLFEALVLTMAPSGARAADPSTVRERCFERVRAVLGGEPAPETAAGIAALERSLALVETGAVVRSACGPRFVHYAVPASLAAPDLARALAVAAFNESLATPALLLPQARARRDGQRIQLLSYATADGWYYDLWYPGYAWAETPQRWCPPGISNTGSSNLHWFDLAALRAAAHDLDGEERRRGRWSVAERLTPFDAMPGRGFPIVMSFVDAGRPVPSSLAPAQVESRLAIALGDLE